MEQNNEKETIDIRKLFFDLKPDEAIAQLNAILNDPQKKKKIDETLGCKKMLKAKNSFLGKTDKVKFYTFDLPQYITCPGKTKLCAAHCYQIAIEKMHKDPDNTRDSTIVFHRKRNLYYSLQAEFVGRMVREIMGLKPRQGTEGTVIIRIHASGDFYDENYLRKW